MENSVTNLDNDEEGEKDRKERERERERESQRDGDADGALLRCKFRAAEESKRWENLSLCETRKHLFSSASFR